MDEKTASVVAQGKTYIEMIKDDPVLPLDYTVASLQNLQVWAESLTGSETSNEYKSQALVGLAVYLGEMLKNKLPDFEFYFDPADPPELQIKTVTGKVVNLTTWIRKASADPKGENLVGKYNLLIQNLSPGQ